ncbi:MAG: hypothetical protein IPJ88_01640 [Myxococcales bacterium]|nr:MAG: hypothetical protein IPJ88_01640 [Myxococcales bacterium]
MFSDFQKARQAYTKQNYAKAIALFEALVGQEPSRVQNLALRLESRKYLGASYLFEKRRKEAAAQFRRLLLEDPSYRLDPLSFPEEVIKVFSAVRDEVLAQRDAEIDKSKVKSDSNEAPKATIELSQAKRMQALIDLAETERVEQENSRWIAMLPFGIGQFQNGHDGLGMVLAVSQAALAVVSLVSFFVYQTIDVPTKLVGQNTGSDREAAQSAEQAWYYTNLVATSLFAGVAVAGIVDAQLRLNLQSRHADIDRCQNICVMDSM